MFCNKMQEKIKPYNRKKTVKKNGKNFIGKIKFFLIIYFGNIYFHI